MILAELVAQLESAKFLRLFRHLIDSPEQADPRDELRLSAEPVPIGEAELMRKRLGHVGSINSLMMTWLFQIVHMPAGVWSSAALEGLMEGRLSEAFAGLARLSDPALFLTASTTNHRTPDWSAANQWSGPERAEYYLFTNVMHDTAEPALQRMVQRAEQAFSRALPTVASPRFGIATPAVLESTAPEAVKEFIVGLLREPSGLHLIARDGRISVSEFTEHGEYAAGARHAAAMSTAVHSPNIENSPRKALLAQLEDLVNHPTTAEADLQRFFTDNPEFLRTARGGFGDVRPHVCLIDPSGGRLTPDFMARIEDESVWQTIELKLPQHPMVVDGVNGPVPSASAARAVAQLIAYRDHFASRANRQKVSARYGISPFEPALTVLIGRDPEARRFRWASSSSPGHPDVDVISYDHLLAQAREWVHQLETDPREKP